MTPAERQTHLAAYARAHADLTAALERFPETMWQFRPASDAWTIHETLIHITDSEANSYIRCRRCIAEPGSTVLGYDEMQWARALDYHARSTAEALELFKGLRQQSYQLIKDLPEATWANTITHSESGVMTLDDWLLTYTRHIPDHIAQMQGVYAAWLKQAAPP